MRERDRKWPENGPLAKPIRIQAFGAKPLASVRTALRLYIRVVLPNVLAS